MSQKISHNRTNVVRRKVKYALISISLTKETTFTFWFSVENDKFLIFSAVPVSY